MTLNELKDCTAAAGVVGAGGAGFPTAVKLAKGADTLLINGAECEPLLYTDRVLLRRELPRIIAGAAQIRKATGIGRSLLCIKQHTAMALGFTDGQALDTALTVCCLPDVYPMGDEVILTYQALHRIVPPGGLPLQVGVLVQNVETVYNIARAAEGIPVTETWLTVAGAVSEPFVTTVPIGTPVSTLLDAAGITVPEDCVLVEGGPAMGNIVDLASAVVKKTTKGLCILPRHIPAITGKLSQNRQVNTHAAANCCQCTLCTDLCPRALIGYPLEPHKVVRSTLPAAVEHPEQFLSAQLCSGCGVCELTACCQGINPRRVYAQIKGILAQNKLRYHGDGTVTPHPDRDYRMLRVERFCRRIGVAPFDRVAEYRPVTLPSPLTLTLPLRQHVGAPATPLVSVGDAVAAGQCIAAANGTVSAALHSPVTGTVTAVGAAAITLKQEA